MLFDDILIQLGQFGKYQKVQYFLLCLPAILCAFHQLAAVFLSSSPPFRCELPDSSPYNQTDTFQIQNEWHKSVVMNYSSIKEQEDNSSLLLEFSKPCEYTDGMECNHYVYSKEDMTNSIVMEFNLVCGETIKATISSAIYMAGVLTGAFFFGILSDLIGRRKTMVICLFFQGSTGLACAFAPEYYSFLTLRFLVGACSMGLFMTNYVLGMELIGPKYRMIAGIVIQYFFAIGYVLLTGIAYVAKEWKYLQIAISAPSFIFLIYFWFVPESARWLISKNRVKEAEDIVQHAATFNAVSLPTNVLQSLEQTGTAEKISSIVSAKTLLVRSGIIFLNWCVVSMGYYGLSLNSGSLGGSIYINFMLGGLVEFPAYTVCFACNKTGRKWMHVAGMLIGGLACLGTVFVDLYAKDVEEDTLTIYFVTLNMVGKFGMTIGFCIIYLWSAELYPTSIRNSMMGFSSTMARIGSIAAPFIADLGKFVPEKYSRVLPASIFGSLVIIGGLLSIYLPETSGHTLPETIDEANRFPRHHEDKPSEPTDEYARSTTDLIDDKMEKETKFSN